MLGRFLDEIAVGFTAELGDYEFTRENVLDFARAYDPQPFHVDDAAAASGPFGRLAASGWHTAAAWMKCYVATCQVAVAERNRAGEFAAPSGPSPGFAGLRWLKPVYPGDRIRFVSRITALRPLASRPDWGLVEALNEGWNQDAELVFSFVAKVMVARRATAP